MDDLQVNYDEITKNLQTKDGVIHARDEGARDRVVGLLVDDVEVFRVRALRVFPGRFELSFPSGGHEGGEGWETGKPSGGTLKGS